MERKQLARAGVVALEYAYVNAVEDRHVKIITVFHLAGYAIAPEHSGNDRRLLRRAIRSENYSRIHIASHLKVLINYLH